LPHLIQSEWRTFTAFFLHEPEPTWNGTRIRVVDPTSTRADLIGIIEWLGCAGAVLGGPNDEAFHGHRLWDRGRSTIGGYGAAEVENSPSFECIATGFRGFRVRESMPRVLGVLAGSVDERDDLPFEEVAKR
jgi:hypothetical protein